MRGRRIAVKMPQRVRSDRGIIFPMTLFIVTVITVLATANMVQTATQVRSSRVTEELMSAVHAAEAGIDAAIIEFVDGGADARINFSFAEGWSDSGGAPCTEGVSCSRTPTLVADAATVTVNDFAASKPVLTAVGTSNGRLQTVEVVIDRPNATPFRWALYGYEYVDM